MQTAKKTSAAQILICTLLGSIIAAINGGIVAIVSASHAWGIVSLVALLAIAYWLLLSTRLVLRKARISNSMLGTRMTMVMMVCYLLAETQISAWFMGTSLPGFYASRWQSGLPLFGAGSWALGGWLWAVLYVVKLLFLFILFYGAAAEEGDRPYCHECGTATTQLVWKQPVGRYDIAHLRDFAKTNHQWDLESLMTVPEQDPSGGSAVLIRIWSCACAQRYEFKAEIYNVSTKIAETEIVGFLPMTASGVARVVQWVWSIDPEATMPASLLEIYRQSPPPEHTDAEVLA